MSGHDDPSRYFSELYLAPEQACVEALQSRLVLDEAQTAAARARALHWIDLIRQQPPPLLARLLQDYPIDSQEGWALIGLSECLLRIPDSASAYEFARAMLNEGHWPHAGQGMSRLSAWLLRLGQLYGNSNSSGWIKLLHRLGDEMFLQILQNALQWMAHNFVFAEDLHSALAAREPDLLYTFDMLGESALCEADAERHLNDYAEAIRILQQGRRSPADGISVKLSAIYPRCDPGRAQQALPELKKRCLWLAEQAAAADIAMTLDAEEHSLLALSLELMQSLCSAASLQSWDGLGIAVQAYQRQAPAVIDCLQAMAQACTHPLRVRLVKGAYWDSEIKQAQQLGLASYPVFTVKRHTDISYLSCAQQLMHAPYLLPQFASHNAHSLAMILAMSAGRPLELQRLHGMGVGLHRQIAADCGVACRVYAPIGRFRELLPYLIRRILENSSQQSFVARLHNSQLDDAEQLSDPHPHQAASPPALPDPQHLVAGRKIAAGFALADSTRLQQLRPLLQDPVPIDATPRPLTLAAPGRQKLYSRAHPASLLGTLQVCDQAALQAACTQACEAGVAWAASDIDERARCLERMADRLEASSSSYLRLLIHEAGKVLMDAQAELREAIDLCRYYAQQARLMQPQQLEHVTGESNILYWRARGLCLCISPWNFPLAIFLGQVSAALVMGNSVVAKPASATPLLAYQACCDLYACGIPEDVLIYAPGKAATIAGLLKHPGLATVAFTGSTDSARELHRQLAEHHRSIIPLIAETGGLNAMIADSTALPEQVVRDVLSSAFNSSGQRCSSCRILFVQDSLAERVETLLAGALQHWMVGDPLDIACDSGPLIDAQAQAQLLAYSAALAQRVPCLGQARVPSSTACLMAPVAYACRFEDLPSEEVFGPILHCVRFKAEEWPRLIRWLQQCAYGLTLGLHTRLPHRAAELSAQLPIGNVYVNRNQIGAVVGQQAFGGRGLSGTGFKAGGPHYLMRFASEQLVCHNLSALGIDPELAMLVT